MKVASLMTTTTDWSYGTTRKYDDFQEKPSYFASRVSPQLPLSPPADDQRKCSLPSISSLLEGADSMPAAKRARHNSAEYNRVFLPPTPPMRPCSGLADGSSPSSTLSRRSHSASIASITSINSAPAMQQSQSQASLPSISASLPTPSSDRGSLSQESRMSPPASTYRASPPAPAPTIATATAAGNSFTPANESSYQSVSPTSPHSHSGPRMISPVNPAWQHHHYFPPSGAAPYPQNHDRYVCRTCHKAFSRPSSLRIHSHSHTGEKPFRCAHAGCGKAFSVRSNMKRHERGCHSGRPLAAVV